MCHHAQLVFLKNVVIGSHYVAQPDLKVLASCDLPALASQSAAITGVSHCTGPHFLIIHMLSVVALEVPSRTFPLHLQLGYLA